MRNVKWYERERALEQLAREAIERQRWQTRPGIVSEHCVFFEALRNDDDKYGHMPMRDRASNPCERNRPV